MQNGTPNPFQYSKESFACSDHLPVRKLSCSSDAGWKSLLVQGFETPSNVEDCTHPATPDQLIVVVSKGTCVMEKRISRGWKRVPYWPGTGGMTAAGSGASDRLRWHSAEKEPMQVLQLYIPTGFLNAAAEHWRVAGTSTRFQFPDTLGFFEPLILQFSLSLQRAAQMGAPNLYAETAAQFLAAHLLARHARLASVGRRTSGSEVMLGRRLQRVCEFIEHHYSRNLTLDEIAQEAGVSKFHFSGIFKRQVGLAPYQYLIRVRMRAAAAFLDNPDLSVKEISSRCGYFDSTTFASAFVRHMGCNPSQYRARLRTHGPCVEDENEKEQSGELSKSAHR